MLLAKRRRIVIGRNGSPLPLEAPAFFLIRIRAVTQRLMTFGAIKYVRVLMLQVTSYT